MRTDGPTWLFREVVPSARLEGEAQDPGIIQASALDVDGAATARAHAGFLGEFESRAAGEAHWLGAHRVRLVVSDAGALACAAAARAGVPAFVVSNFSWDWILAPYARAEPALSRAAQRYARAYGRAEAALRLPLHSDFAAFRHIEDFPHLVRRSQRSAAEVRRALGIEAADDRPLLLVSFGGFGQGSLGELRCDLGPEWIATGYAAPPRGFLGRWIRLATPAPVAHPELVAAADAVLGKTGYGTVAEALCHGARFLYLRRPDYPEDALLAAGLEASGAAREISRRDFLAGRWRDALEDLLELPRPSDPPPCDGAPRVAARLLEALG